MKPWHLIKASLGATALAAPFLFARRPPPRRIPSPSRTTSPASSARKGSPRSSPSSRTRPASRVADSPIGHEDFKTGILVRAAGNNLPDVFSYWAGARTQFVVDAGNIMPIDDMWAAEQARRCGRQVGRRRRHAV